MCTFGSDARSSVGVAVEDEACSVEVAALSVGGVGPREMLMTCSIPARCIASMTSPLKKSMSIDFSWMKRGCESNSSDAKCSSGLCPGVAFGVWQQRT